MTVTAEPKPIDWKRIALILVVLGILGYQWYQNNQQSAQPVAQAETANPIPGSESNRIPEDNGSDYEVVFQPPRKAPPASDPISAPASGSRSNVGAASGKSDSSKPTSNRPVTTKLGKPSGAASSASKEEEFLQSAGGRNLKSPAGLIFSMGPGGEHRVEHVMRHAQDDKGRPSHGVFDGDQDTILKLLDEAYEMVKEKSKYVKSEASQGNTAYTISMGRRIGYEGGEKGTRSRNQGLRSLKLILDGNRVITAYPCR